MNKIEDPHHAANPAEQQANEKEMATSSDGAHKHTLVPVKDHTHTLTVATGGDHETLPKSYTVNYFVKVN
jgi:hypothetical protein